jgi:hypothetical protein
MIVVILKPAGGRAGLASVSMAAARHVCHRPSFTIGPAAAGWGSQQLWTADGDCKSNSTHGLVLCFFSPGKAETLKHLILRIRALYQYIHYCIYIYGRSVQAPRGQEHDRRVRRRTPSFMSRPGHVAFQSSITKVTPSCFLKECVV